MLKGKKVLLGISASIAAYKAADLVRLLTKLGASVKVIQTEASIDFIAPLTLSTLSKNQVLSKMIDKDTNEWNNHVKLGLWADLMLIAPATANTIFKLSTGSSDDLASTVVLASNKEIFLVPAMNVRMWEHQSTKENLQKLRNFGYQIIGP